MTIEEFQKAQEIRESMHYLMELKWCIKNSKGHILKAINKNTCDTMNEVSMVDDSIIYKLISTINSELTKLEDEFSNL